MVLEVDISVSFLIQRAKVLDAVWKFFCGPQLLETATIAWRYTVSDTARRRRDKDKSEAELAATRRSAATLIQAVWRSHNTKKVLDMCQV